MADLSDNTNWFETDASNNKASPNGWPEGMMPSGVNDTARGDKGALKRFWDRINPVQIVSASGGIYTFTTSNTAYPTAYIYGEIYSFRPSSSSIGNDQFQVNALGAKPIWKYFGGAAAPIRANDIVVSNAASLLYDNTLNGGAGAFVLLNPFVPISGDGAGGIISAGSINGYALGANGIGYPIGEGHAIAFGWNGTSLIAHVDGTNTPGALATAASLGNYMPLSGGTVTGSLGVSGSLEVSGNLTAGAVFTVGGLQLYNNAGYLYSATALRAPLLVSDGNTVTSGTLSCTNVTASIDVDAGGVFRRSGAAGARIECFGGSDWGFMTFAISSGSLVISPDNGSSGFIFGPGTGFSDARLKDNIHDTKVDALAAICATPVREFEWNEEGRKLMPHIDPMVPCGLVAQELEETMPFAVGVAPLADGMRHIIDQNVTPYLMRAIQQLTERVVELEGRLARE